MSSFVSRGAVLASARLLNQALALLSPLLLVRLLEIAEYGRYRQFMATAMFITSLAGFALAANLNYLIARSPQRQSVDISNTCLLMLAVSVVSALIVVLARHWIVPPEIARRVAAARGVRVPVPESRSAGVLLAGARPIGAGHGLHAGDDRVAARNAARRHVLAARRRADFRHHRLRRSAEESAGSTCGCAAAACWYFAGTRRRCASRFAWSRRSAPARCSTR